MVARKKKTTLGESIQQWRESLCAQNRPRALCSFYRRTSKAYKGASVRSWTLILCKKGNSGICSEEDCLSSFSLFLFSIGSGHTGGHPLTLRHLVAWSERCFSPASGRNGGPNISRLHKRGIPTKSESSSWAGVTGRQQ
ncbi:hypothetical protein LY78DRAFT_155808 [Colletotrichum sublineola]|nr:hypothetical protein LY78DRAFT_155808 [Colletotrichum sublineola]